MRRTLDRDCLGAGFENSAQVAAYLEALKNILTYTGVSNCKMEEGSMRCDINLSIHKEGEPFGTRTEMKNLNSISAARNAVDYEEARQRQVVEAGGVITQDTLRWDDEKGLNYAMRTKEDADEYYYFPEPDIMPLVLSEEYIQGIAGSLRSCRISGGPVIKRNWGFPLMMPDFWWPISI